MQKQVVSRCLMFDGSINLLLVYYAGVAADIYNFKDLYQVQSTWKFFLLIYN
jgi:hypothetical protein